VHLLFIDSYCVNITRGTETPYTVSQLLGTAFPPAKHTKVYNDACKYWRK